MILPTEFASVYQKALTLINREKGKWSQGNHYFSPSLSLFKNVFALKQHPDKFHAALGTAAGRENLFPIL